jgi:hypothetical protein
MKPQPLYRQPFHTLTVAESGAENRTPKHCRELERANTRGSARAPACRLGRPAQGLLE